jgi:hypothetical protein
LDRLQRVQKAAARLLHGAKKFDSIHPVLFDLHWLPIVFRIDYKIAVFTYRCFKGLSPRYLHSLLRLPASSRLACDRLITAKPRTKTYGSRSFTVYALSFGIPFHRLSLMQLPLPSFVHDLKHI